LAAPKPRCNAFSAEPDVLLLQIVLPAGLDEVLKNFTKEAIRNQPHDLVDFGAT
jgi:hypothetical protein